MPTIGDHNVQTGEQPVTPCVLTGEQERPPDTPGILDVNRGFSVQVGLSASDEAANVIQFTLQLQDAQGNDLAARVVMDFWLSSEAFGAPVAVDLLAVSTGRLLSEIELGSYVRATSDANGTVVVDALLSGVASRVAMASAAGSEAISLPASWT